ncbi:MAG: hypothetical protein GY870_12650 [archaeon]|nr:hypothetical protein [archaeon]
MDEEKALRYADTLREFWQEKEKGEVGINSLMDFYETELKADMEDYDKSGCASLKDMNEKDWQCLIDANKINSGLLSYGVKGSTATEKGTFMSWSNGSRSWGVFKPVQKGESVRLDANQMIIPCSPLRAQRIRCYIKELPLYFGSTEAKLRGEVSLKESFDIVTEGHMGEVFDKLPKEMADKLKKQIKDKGWGFFFGKR